MVSMGRAIADTPPAEGLHEYLGMHSYWGIVPGEGGGTFTIKAGLIWIKYDDPSPTGVGSVRFDDPDGTEDYIDTTTSGPNDTLHNFGGVLYMDNWSIFFDYRDFPVDDQMHIRFKTLNGLADVTGGVIDETSFHDFNFTEWFPFNNDGFSDWRGPFYITDSVYYWFMDAEENRMSLWVNSLNTPTAPWTEAYGEDAIESDQYYIIRVTQMISGRRVALSRGVTRPHILYAEYPDYATWTPVEMDAGFNPLEFGIQSVGGAIIAVQADLSLTSSTIRYWFSTDGVTDWTLVTPSVTASGPFVLKGHSKMFTDGLHFLITVFPNRDGEMGPLVLYGMLGGFVGLTNFPDYASFTNTQRKYSLPRIEYAFWHSGRETWFLNYVTATYDTITGASLILEYSADMTTELNRWDIGNPTGGDIPLIDGMQNFQTG